jgi:hypothetical protein
MPVRDLLNAASSQGAGPSDPYFYDVSLLLNGDGTNGAQNNTFLDSSTNNFTITRNGNTTQGSFSPYGSLWSNYFNGSSSLSTGSSSNLALGTGDFTISFWTFFTGTGPRFYSSASSGGPIIYANGSNTLLYEIYAGSNVLTASSNLTPNTWNYIVVSRVSGTSRMFVNGTQVASGSDSNNLTNGGTNYIGTDNGSQFINGYISNFSIVKGAGVTSVTVPTIPKTAITGTQLLTCQSNQFIDNSSNAFAITVNGSPSVQRFSPFNPTTPYSTTTIGGSGYFDGSSYLIAGSGIILGTNDFTVEAWYYSSNVSSQAYFAQNEVTADTGDWGFFINSSGNLQFSSYTTNFLTVTSGLISNQWNHVAVTRSGSTLAIYSNGVQRGTASISANLADANTLTVGNYAVGYMTDTRIVNGTALYTGSTYTVPTAPETPITNTALLLSYTNAGIPDLAMQNDLQTVGSAQVSTSVVKYGTGSLYFDGSGSILYTPVYTPTMGSGDFTIEYWMNTSGSSDVRMFTFGDNNASGSLHIIYTGQYIRVNWESTGGATGTHAVNGGTWHYFALVRSGGTLKSYVDGVLDVNYGTVSVNFNNPALSVGGNSSLSSYYTGYIDDLRISNYARYTSNFTPPTAALPTY